MRETDVIVDRSDLQAIMNFMDEANLDVVTLKREEKSGYNDIGEFLTTYTVYLCYFDHVHSHFTQHKVCISGK